MERPLRIGYFADGRWARRALDHIVEAPELRVLFIVGRHPEPDPKLRDYARRIGVPFTTEPDVNRAEFVDSVREYGADIHVSMSFDQILQPEIIELAPEGFINCHAGALPFYRGRNVLNWVLINGEDRFGVTVHFMDQSIDTGDIITQKFADITEADDYASLLDKATELCAETLYDALLQIRTGEADPTPQREVHPVGFYCSKRREGDEWIDWTWSTERIHNLVRALVPPGPGARTLLDGVPMVILESEKIPQAPEYIDRPGTVVGRGAEGVLVKTGDTTLKVSKIADWNDGIANPRTPDFPLGTTFGINLRHEVKRLANRVDRLEQRLETLEAE